MIYHKNGATVERITYVNVHIRKVLGEKNLLVRCTD